MGTTRFPMLRLYYDSIFLPMITFAVGAWGDLVGVRQKDSLLTTQRFMLIRVTKVYRTTSTEALQVTAGILPLDLESSRDEPFSFIRRMASGTSSDLTSGHAAKQRRYDRSNRKLCPAGNSAGLTPQKLLSHEFFPCHRETPNDLGSTGTPPDSMPHRQWRL